MARNSNSRGTEIFSYRRRSVARHALSRADALLITNPVDVGYLTGFSGEEDRSAYLILSRSWEVLIPGRFYRELAGEECAKLERFSAPCCSS